MKTNSIIVTLLLITNTLTSQAQDTMSYKLRLTAPLIDLPQNYPMKYRGVSMDQAFELSNDLYEVSFWGIDALGNKLFVPKNKPYTRTRKCVNGIFKYGLSLGFSYFGSELPIPLGVWGHEEYHRSVLGVGNVSSKNGNWLLNRWDGTVYGVSDSVLTRLKADDVNNLLYSYVAGVQYEIQSNQQNTLADFYKRRTFKKSGLLLYNAYYVYNYFRFSTSSVSDSVKVLAPPHESQNSSERDYAGADLTAWVYDMFNPSVPFTVRDSFPNGEGVNRRIGFSDLSNEAQSFLTKQKQLSLLNFINPGILFVNRIKLSQDLSFNFFTQYTPTHFGNDVALFLPVKYRRYDVLLHLHRYSNNVKNGLGIGVGLYNYQLSRKLETDVALIVWNQPNSFLDAKKTTGGQISVVTRYALTDNWSMYLSMAGKTRGWVMGDPYLRSNFSLQLGVNYQLAKH
jgi:hypothetical protein